MRLEQLTVHLRARSSWEAMELGMALVRRHAAAIWKPWLLATLPVFALLNAIGWALDLIGLAGLAMWWLKPVFDRIPLYVISRAVFGATPGTRETLAAQLRWGWKPMPHYLTWRRFSPARSLYLPVDLLEGVGGQRLRDRRRTLGRAVYGNAALLTLVCMHFEVALCLAGVAAILMFAPLDYLPEALRTTWTLIFEQSPAWVDIGLNAIIWLATSIVEPFFVGAGFGIYLNRRTELEAWDVEIVFRKLRNRIASGASALILGCALLAGLTPIARAQEDTRGTAGYQAGYQDEDDIGEEAVEESDHESTDEPEAGAGRTPTLPEVFGDRQVDDRRFREAAERAYADPALNRTRVQKSWERRDQSQPEPGKDPKLDWLAAPMRAIAFLGEWGLWILAGALVLVLALTARRWLPWMRGTMGRAPRFDGDVAAVPSAVPDALPDDVATTARRLWKAGQRREALALLYRAGVAAMTRRLQVELPPGATESECLRLSRRMPQGEDRQLFARIVRVWQYAAYAQRMPEEGEFEALLAQMRERGGWLA